MPLDQHLETSNCRGTTNSSSVPDQSSHGDIGGMIRPAYSTCRVVEQSSDSSGNTICWSWCCSGWCLLLASFFIWIKRRLMKEMLSSAIKVAVWAIAFVSSVVGFGLLTEVLCHLLLTNDKCIFSSVIIRLLFVIAGGLGLLLFFLAIFTWTTHTVYKRWGL